MRHSQFPCLYLLLSSVLFCSIVFLSSCVTPTPTTQNTNEPTLIAPQSLTPVSGQLEVDNYRSPWQPATLAQVSKLIGQTVPFPVKLPAGFEIKEIYYSFYILGNSRLDVRFLISDSPVKWDGAHYSCPIVLNLGWNELGAGFKGLTGHIFPPDPNIPEGVVQQNATEWDLWWEYNMPNGQSVFKMQASPEFSQDTLLSIPASTPKSP